jgi:hypothetical protein
MCTGKGQSGCGQFVRAHTGRRPTSKTAPRKAWKLGIPSILAQTSSCYSELAGEASKGDCASKGSVLLQQHLVQQACECCSGSTSSLACLIYVRASLWDSQTLFEPLRTRHQSEKRAGTRGVHSHLNPGIPEKRALLTTRDAVLCYTLSGRTCWRREPGRGVYYHK